MVGHAKTLFFFLACTGCCRDVVFVRRRVHEFGGGGQERKEGGKERRTLNIGNRCPPGETGSPERSSTYSTGRRKLLKKIKSYSQGPAERWGGDAIIFHHSSEQANLENSFSKCIAKIVLSNLVYSTILYMYNMVFISGIMHKARKKRRRKERISFERCRVFFLFSQKGFLGEVPSRKRKEHTVLE